MSLKKGNKQNRAFSKSENKLKKIIKDSKTRRKFFIAKSMFFEKK